MLRLLLLLLLITPISTVAQPVLENAENLETGESYDYMLIDHESVDIGEPGADKTWDFSTPDEVEPFKRSIYRPEETVQHDIFPEANVADNIRFDRWFFHEIDGNVNYIWGVVMQIEGEAIEVEYLKPFQLINRPVSFNDSLISESRRTYEAMGQTFTGSGNTLVTADAWGTLILPDTTYEEVLRTRTNHFHQDTSSGFLETVLETSIITYAWYHKDFPTPVFSLDSVVVSSDLFSDIIVNAQYLQLQEDTTYEDTTGNNLVAGQTDNYNISAFTCHDEMCVNYPFQGNEKVTLLISDLSGRIVSQTSKVAERGDQMRINVPVDEMSGIYINHITIDGPEETRRKTIKSVF